MASSPRCSVHLVRFAYARLPAPVHDLRVARLARRAAVRRRPFSHRLQGGPPPLHAHVRASESKSPLVVRRSGGHTRVRTCSDKSSPGAVFFVLVPHHELNFELIPLPFPRDPALDPKRGRNSNPRAPRLVRGASLLGDKVEVDSVAYFKGALREEGNCKHFRLRSRWCRVLDREERRDVERDVDCGMFPACEHFL